MENVFAIIFHVLRLCMRQITMNNEVESPESQFEIENTDEKRIISWKHSECLRKKEFLITRHLFKHL